MSSKDAEPVFIVEDHFGSGFGAGLEKLPHVEAAIEQLRGSPLKMDKLHQALSAEISRPERNSRPQ